MNQEVTTADILTVQMWKLRHRVVKSFAQCYRVADSGLNPIQADPRGSCGE